MERIRVLVAGGHPVFIEGLCRIMAEENDLHVVGFTTNPQELVSLAIQSLPHVVILDATTVDWLESLQKFREHCPTTPVLLTGANEHGRHILPPGCQQAVAYLPKSRSVSRFVRAVRVLHSGGGLDDEEAKDKAICSSRLAKTGHRPIHGNLTEREMHIIRVAATGATNEEIGQTLGMSGRTVQSHFVTIFTKLDVHSRTEAIVRALREGWITLDDLP